MKVRLKYRAFLPKIGLLGPGVVDWPEGFDLPSTAEKLTAKEAKEEEKAKEPETPIAPSELDIGTGNRKK